MMRSGGGSSPRWSNPPIWRDGRRPLADELAALPTAAIALHKQLFDRAPANTLAEQLELEASLQTSAAGTADFAEGMAAFREKRATRFRGA